LRFNFDLKHASRDDAVPSLLFLREFEANICRSADAHEGLTASLTAKIRITREEALLRVEIEDSGKGIPPEKQTTLKSSTQSGVGFRGMSERLRILRILGGTLEINSHGCGTKVTAIVPVARNDGSETQELHPDISDTTPVSQGA